jgi:hypothetical protein
MKKLLSLSLLSVAALMAGGCGIDPGATPAYSSAERFNQISRNWAYEWSQINDDTDHLLLLRPEGNLTGWDVYHRE